MQPDDRQKPIRAEVSTTCCHISEHRYNVSVSSGRYASEQLIYLLVYQQMPEPGLLMQKVSQKVIRADRNGRFEAALPGPFPSEDKFWIIAGTSPEFVESGVEESLAPLDRIDNGIDCFIVL